MKLKDICLDMHQGINTVADKVQYYNEGYPIIQSKNITKGFLDLEDVRYVDSNTYQYYKEKYKPEIDDILLANIGTIGKSIIAKKNIDFLIAWNIFIIKLDKSKILPQYLKFFFDYLYTINYYSKFLTGGTVKFINKKTMSEIIVPDLNIKEQKKIANKLEKAQEIIDIRKKQIKELDKLVKSQFVEMFENKNFNEEELIKLCRFIDYRGKTPTKCDNGIPLITAKNVKNNSFSFEPREYFLPELYESHMTRGRPKVGDVLFTTEAPLGNVCRIPEIEGRFAVGQRIITMQVYNKITEVYLEQVLQSETFQSKMWKESSGSTVKGIKSRLLEKITIPVPPIELQNKFAEFVSQVDKQKFEIQKSLEEMKELQESLMNKYFG